MVVGDTVGVHRATVCRIVKRVTEAVASLAATEITFPATDDERSAVKRDFYSIAQFPGVIGAIDCTHVAIQSPGGDNAELFRNRKGYFSINVQAVCKANLQFTNVVARWFGSAHDATIFSNSRVRAELEQSQGDGGYLLGDGGYPCKEYLLTPIAAPQSVAEERYNTSHIRTRNTVERAFGVVKRRFPSLRMGLRIKVWHHL